jgi:hypothetical protein
MIADLTDAEIDSICDGYIQNAAKVRFLRSMGLTVRVKPNGKPLVNRNHYDAVLGCAVQNHQSSSAGPVWGVH